MAIDVRRTAATSVTFAGAQAVVISHLDDSIKIGDGVNFLSINASGEAQVRDDDLNTSLDSIVSNRLPRIEEDADRTYVKEHIIDVDLDATGTVIHTVTGGQTFYMTGYQVYTTNSANADSSLVIQDGTDTTDRLTFRGSARISGQVDNIIVAVAPDLGNNPMPFTADVRAIEISGDLTASITIWGYEE